MIKLTVIASAMLLGASALAQTHIYKSEDEAGNPVFSDKASSGSSEIEVSESNIVDAVKVPDAPEPEPAPEEAPPPPEPAWQAPDPDAGPDVIIIGDQTVPRREADSGDNPRHEVSDAEARGQQSSAVPRHEVD